MEARSLSAEDQGKIRSSALSAEHLARLAAAGWYTDGKGQLVIPYRNPDGSPQTMPDGSPWIRFRLAQAKINADPKGPKYLSLKEAGCRLYHPALSADHEKRLGDHDVPLRITEGELKGESCAAHDRKRVTIAIAGVDAWRDRRSGESEPLPELDQIPLNGREVRLCFDSDLNKPSVRRALKSLAIWLTKKGADVMIERLPNAPERDRNGEIIRLGADDMIHGYGVRGFLRVCDLLAEFCVEEIEDPESGKKEFIFQVPYDPEPNKAVATFIRAEYLTALLGRTWRSDPERPDGWQRWTGTHWERIDGNDPINAAVERFLDCQGWRVARAKTNVTGLVAAFRRQIEPAADSSAADGLLPFRNGCLMLSDQRFIPHRPENGNTWSLPYDYDRQANCTEIKKFLKDRLGDAASVAVFRAFARALLHCEPMKCFLEITGPSNTGKTVLSNLLQALVGRNNTAACALQRIEDKSQRFETLKLRGKRLAVFSECQDYSGKLEVVKALTGDEKIPAEIKNGKHVDFNFYGGVVLTGNGPIRASDPSGAVINRRRSFHVDKVVHAADERELLKSTAGGWRGEFVPELPGLVNWCLAMPAADARRALARDVQSPARAASELRTLLETDNLAEWADLNLVWDGQKTNYIRVGMADGVPAAFAYPSYLKHIREQGVNVKPLSMKVFKKKLVDLLRDTIGLPLPPGDVREGNYRNRDHGSIVPCLRFRTDADGEAQGLITQGFMYRAEGPVGDRSGWMGDGSGMDKTQSGMDCDGWDGSEPLSPNASSDPGPDKTHIGVMEPQSVPSIPIRPQQRSSRPESIPDPSRSIPQAMQAPGYQPITVDGEPGWQLPGVMPKGNGPTVNVPVVDPKGVSRVVKRQQISLPASNSLKPSELASIHAAYAPDSHLGPLPSDPAAA